MKVCELMNELSKFPSGANVRCSATLSVPELENCENLGEDEFGDELYSVYKDLDYVENSENNNNLIYLNF